MTIRTVGIVNYACAALNGLMAAMNAENHRWAWAAYSGAIGLFNLAVGFSCVFARGDRRPAP